MAAAGNHGDVGRNWRTVHRRLCEGRQSVEPSLERIQLRRVRVYCLSTIELDDGVHRRSAVRAGIKVTSLRLPHSTSPITPSIPATLIAAPRITDVGWYSISMRWRPAGTTTPRNAP